MTYVVVKKLNGHFFADHIDGMVDAGVKINDILTRNPEVDYKDIFETMFEEMAGGAAPNYSVDVADSGAEHPLARLLQRPAKLAQCVGVFSEGTRFRRHSERGR